MIDLSQPGYVVETVAAAVMMRLQNPTVAMLHRFAVGPDTGEPGLWNLARRRRKSIIRWLGIEGYETLEANCKVVADKTMRALTTQKQDHFIEAAAFRGAVVNQIHELAARQSEGRVKV